MNDKQKWCPEYFIDFIDKNKPFSYYWYGRSLKFLLNEIRDEDALLLDAGCGFGRVTKELLKFNRLNVISMDINFNNIKYIKQQHKNFKGVVGDIKNLPFKNNIFKYSILMYVIDFIENPEKVLSEFDRILTENNGKFIMNFANKNSFNYLIRRLYVLAQKIKNRKFKETIFYKSLKNYKNINKYNNMKIVKAKGCTICTVVYSTKKIRLFPPLFLFPVFKFLDKILPEKISNWISTEIIIIFKKNKDVNIKNER